MKTTFHFSRQFCVGGLLNYSRWTPALAKAEIHRDWHACLYDIACSSTFSFISVFTFGMYVSSDQDIPCFASRKRTTSSTVLISALMPSVHTWTCKESRQKTPQSLCSAPSVVLQLGTLVHSVANNSIRISMACLSRPSYWRITRISRIF